MQEDQFQGTLQRDPSVLPQQQPLSNETQSRQLDGWQQTLTKMMARGAGAAELAAYIAKQVPENAHPKVWAFLHETRGNGFVQEVIAETERAETRPSKGPDPVAPILAQIASGETSLKIEGDAAFKGRIMSLLGGIASRPAGLGLLKKLMSSKHPIVIDVAGKWDESAIMVCAPDHGEASQREQKADGTPNVGDGSRVHVNRSLPEITNFDEAGKEIESPAYVTLSHELIHALHSSEGKNKRSLEATRPGQDNMEEQETIETGELSENTIRKEHGLPLRAGHSGGPKTTERSKLIDSYKRDGIVVLESMYQPTLAPETVNRIKQFIATCDRVLQLDELWEVDAKSVQDEKQRAQRLVSFGPFAAKFGALHGAEISAGYQDFRAYLTENEKAEPDIFKSLMGGIRPADVTPPNFAKLDRDGAHAALNKLDEVLGNAGGLLTRPPDSIYRVKDLLRQLIDLDLGDKR